MKRRVGAKVPPHVENALLKVLDPPTRLIWRKVKFDKNDKLIVAAVEVAKPPADLAGKFRADVASAMHAIAEAGVGRPKVKDVKEAAKVYAAALRRLQKAWKPDLLPPDLAFNELTLAKLIAYADEIAEPSSPDSRPQRPVEVKHDAAAHAHALMTKYRLEIKGTKGSRYCKLAAVLSGRRNDNLVRQCQEHIRIRRDHLDKRS
ncbi:hypothetical protein [Bradyrhizobium sp. SZCCHNR1070]|uniref:hypothetical protein n=1 Tax=Bradyrhizobium sp. SZCCHNR1070 TaxID=3057361 RepID=UPI0029163F62|nr:hypothetical protein [Bradyrhizobium sp. SZCCHNR1070]